VVNQLEFLSDFEFCFLGSRDTTRCFNRTAMRTDGDYFGLSCRLSKCSKQVGRSLGIALHCQFALCILCFPLVCTSHSFLTLTPLFGVC
jgi:hypothetical protein